MRPRRPIDLEKIIQRVGELLGMSREDVLEAGKSRRTVSARSLLCYWAVGELRISMTALSVRLSISVDAVSKSVARGKLLSKLHNYSLY